MEIRQPYPPGAPHDRGPGYERRDANVRGLLQFAFWMAVVLAVTLVGMKLTFDYFKRVQPLGATSSPLVNEAQPTLPPKPRLQVQPHVELQEYCAAQQQHVSTYGWVDRESGVVRIPVDRAMDLVLERGLPSRPTAEAPGGMLPESAAAPRVPGGVDPLGPCGYLGEQPMEAPPIGINE